MSLLDSLHSVNMRLTLNDCTCVLTTVLLPLLQALWRGHAVRLTRQAAVASRKQWLAQRRLEDKIRKQWLYKLR
jgi:hypothetical protein